MADGDLLFPDQHKSAVANLEPAAAPPEELDFPDKQPTLERGFWDTYSQDPDHAAKVLSYAQRFNEPENFIDKNLPTVEKAAAAPTSQYWADLEKNYPGTTKFLIDPKNMTVAKDDTHNLSATEGIVRRVKDAWETESNALKAGSLQETRDLLQAQKVFGYGLDASTFTGYLTNRLAGVGKGMTPDERIAAINAQLADLDKQKPTSLVGRGVYGATEFLPWIGGGLAKGAEYSLALAGVGALAGIETGPGALATGGVGALAGLGIGEAEYNFLRMTGAARSQFEQIRDKDGNPLPENTINIASVAAGVATSSLGLIKINSIISRIPGGNDFLQKFQASVGDQVLKPATYKAAMARFAKTWATGTAEATAAGTGIAAVNIGTGAIAKATSGQPFDYSPRDAVKELGATVGETALTFGTLGLPGPLAGLGMDTYQVRRAEQTKKVFEALAATEKDSKLRARLPEARQAFVDSVTKGTPIENVYTPVQQFEKYFQEQNIDPNKVASELGISDQLAQARETGADLQIPTSTWAAKIVGTPHEQGLAEDFKFHPDDLTVRQARDQAISTATALQTAADSAVKENPGLQPSRQAVFDDVHDQLVAAGRPEREAQAGATVWASRAVIEAQRRGMTPEAWYQGAHLRVTDDPNAQPRADAPATPDFPHGFDPDLMHRMVYDAVAQEGFKADEKEVSRLLLRYGQDPRYVVAALHSGEEAADKLYFEGKLPTMAESVAQPQIPETKFRHSKKEIESRATALRDREVEAYDAGKESDLLNRINGKIKWTKDLESLGDLSGDVVPWWLRKQIFTKDPNAPSLDAKAQELGMSANDLIKEIVDYQKTREAAPSRKVEDYFDQARNEIENEKRQGQIDAATAAAKESALPTKISRVMNSLGISISEEDPNKLRQEQLNLFDQSNQPHPDAIVPAKPEPAAAEPTKAAEPAVKQEAAAPAPTRLARGTKKVHTGEAIAGKLGDVGEELWYNRRNINARKLTWDTVKDLNPTLKQREVTKQKIWPRPDYEQMVADGLNPLTAHLVKQVYDSIASAPEVRGEATDAQLKTYIDEVNRVKEAVYTWAKDTAAQKAWAESLLKSRGGDSLISQLGVRAHTALLDALYPKPDNAQSSHRRFHDNPDYNEKARLLGGNKFVQALQPSFDSGMKATKAIKEGWPAPQEAWQRRFDIRESPAGTAVYRNGQKVVLDKPEFFIVAKGKRQILAADLASREEAIAKAQELAQVKRKAGQSEEALDMASLKREGPVLRPAGLDAQPKDIMTQFGFRGLNFGNWTNNVDRVQFTNHAYDALSDLARELNIPAKAVGLDGLLGLAFGAQGHGGFAAAHFIPGVNEINLTKTSGPGSLAHEWAHGLDHYFAVQAGLGKKGDPFLSSHAGAKSMEGIRPEIANAFKTIVEAMNQRDETPEQVAERQAKVASDASKRLDSWLKHFRSRLEADAKPEAKEQALKDFDLIANRMRSGDVGEGYEQISRGMGVHQAAGEVRRLFKDATGRIPSVDEIRALDGNASFVRYLKVPENQERSAKPQSTKTEYLKAAEKLDEEKGGKPYWTNPTEMFARAFSSYVLDKMEAEARRNDFLVRPQGGDVESHPHGEERTKINAAFDTLVKNLKSRETDRGTALYQGQIGSDLFGQPYLEGAKPKKQDENQASLFDQQAKPQFETSQNSLTPQHGLPVVAEEAKTGAPHAVFSYNWRLSKDSEPIPYYRLYGDKDLIEAQTKIPSNPTGNTWRSDVTEETVKAAGIPIIGKSPKATEEPYRPADTQGKLFQGPDITDPRGFIQFTPRETLVALVQADASTFMHESAHYWLKDLHDYVLTGAANEKTMADWKILANWLGVKEDQTALTRDQQEKFARGFESYLREGKSPSETLRKTFSLFRRWLSKLYRDPAMLNVNVSDDVRGVMDRMLASEDEIAFAQKQAGYELAMTKEIEGLDPEVRAKVGQLADAAHEEAVLTLLRKQLKETTEEHKAMLSAEREKATEAAKKAVAQLPEEVAGEVIRRSTMKTKVPRKAAEAYIAKGLSDRDKTSFDAMAEMQGYMSGDEMAKKILAAKTAKEEIAARVEAHMAQFADLRNTDAIKDEAIRAIHNDKQAELMAYERQIFQNLAREAQGNVIEKRTRAAEAKVEAAVARAKAREIIQGKSVREAGQFMGFFTAERNAAANVAKALAAKDYEKAAEFKRQQMLNHELVRESYAAKEAIDKAMRGFKRFADRGRDLKDIPYGFIRQIDRLLGDRGLAEPRTEDAATFLKIAQDMAKKGADPEAIANATGWVSGPDGRWVQESLAETAGRISNNYYLLDIPESILTGQPKPYQQMKFGEFMDLKTAVKSLNDIGRRFERFLNDSVKADIKTAALEAANSIREKVGTPYADSRTAGHKASAMSEKIDALMRQPGDHLLDMVNLTTLCKYLDGGASDGPMQNYVYRLLKHAEDRELDMKVESVKQINEVLKNHFTEKEFKALSEDRVHFDFLPENKSYLTHEEMVAVALNWGNEGNRERIRSGNNWSDAQVMSIINGLSKKEMDFVQAAWDHLDTYWPQIVALEMKASGVEPKKVENAEVETIHGTYKGGYYPLAYDFDKSSEAYRQQEDRNALYKMTSTVAAHTEHGHTKARVQNLGRPVRLDLNVLFRHMENVVHDLAFRESVIDVNRFLRQKDVREAVQNAIGGKGLRTLEDGLAAAASYQGEPLDGMQKALRRIRMGGSLMNMAWKLFSFPMDLTGNVLNSIWEIGPTRTAQSISDFAMDPKGTIDFVNQLSPRMRQRATIRDRELRDLANRWHGETSFYHQTAYITMSSADEAISYPMWKEVYNHNVLAHGPEKARDMADEAIAQTMGSGSIIDQAAVQRGSEYKKIFTYWYSWMGMMFNRAWLGGKMAGLEYDRGNLGKASAIVGKTLLFGWFLQSVQENFWRELFRNSPQGVDDDQRKKRILNRTIQQPFGYVPGVRDVANFMVDKSLGQQSDIKPSAFGIMETLGTPFAELAYATGSGKPLNDRFAEHTANALATWYGTPKQLNAWVFNFVDFLKNDGELTWRDILMRRTKR